jgi:hypothetical protein
MPCSGPRLLALIPAPMSQQEPLDGSPRPTPPLPRCQTAVIARCAPPSRDGRLRRRALRPSAVPHRRDARCSSLHANLRSIGLPLPFGAKRLKPGASRQAASHAHQAVLPSPQQASVAAYTDALSCVRMRWCPPLLRPMPRAATSARSSTSSKSATLCALHGQLPLPLLAMLLTGTPALPRRRRAVPPWHREHGYKRAPHTSCPHRTPLAVFLQ